MSLLERALRRARSENAVDTSITAPDGAHVSNTVFVSPWHFDEKDSVLESQVATHPAPVPAPGPPSAAPHAPSLPRFAAFRADVRKKLVLGNEASPTMREQFRNIASTLYRMRDERKIKTIMVVSAVPGEGKTLTSTNLALTLSESYRTHVLLIDADLRRPSLHRLLDVPNEVGLKDDLAALTETPPSSVRVTAHLDVLLAGSASLDPMSALTSERMRSILRRAAAEFDWVVIDTPPVELMSDAKILAAAADVAVLVVEAGRTPCESARKAIDAVGRERVMGVVLNRLTDPRDLPAYAYDGYGGYTNDAR
jgi:capsular exopolysaccharide synthesis family protein